MEVCVEISNALQATICKNLFLCNRQKTDFYLLMMPGDKKFKTQDLLEKIISAMDHDYTVVSLPRYQEGASYCN